jgi:phenylacetyl-CoA:acceptor oxidoreductase subunit 1
MTRYGMVVDINRCVGCQTCTIACKHANDTPPGVQWRQVLDVERGAFPDVERLFLLVGCQHCAEPPCVPVCPSGATKQRADGLVTMDYDTCIGCGYCAVACPYQARSIVHDRAWYYGAPSRQEEAVFHGERIGVANKCSFCIERIDEAAENGLVPGIDPEVTPACAASCIAQAINFGDLHDPGSDVSALVRENRTFRMHESLGTEPQIHYLYEVPGATPGRDPEPEDVDDTAMSDLGNPLVGKRQSFWDFRAAMNFTLGGMGSGLAVMALLTYLFAGLSQQGLLALYVAASAFMAVGLFFVFLEIGRKLRFLNVLRRPQSSWMTRETYVVGVFYPALLADLIWPGVTLHLLVGAAALVFLYCQGRILQAGKGIPAWRVPLMPWMLVATGLLEGTGLLVLGTVLAPALTGTSMVLPAAAGLLFALVNAGLWRAYRSGAAARGIGPLARRVIDRITPLLHLVGHALPGLLFAAALFWDMPGIGLAGIAAVVGGILWKFTVITRACHQQGYAVPKMPQRGSGRRAAPARLRAA